MAEAPEVNDDLPSEDDDYEDVEDETERKTETKPSFRPMTRARTKILTKWEKEMMATSHSLAAAQAELAVLKKQMQRAETKRSGPDKSAPEKLMPMKYAGVTDFDDYLVQFETIAGLHGWSEDRRGAVLMAKLEGIALSVATPVSDKGYKAMTTKLRERFSPEQQEAFALRLKTRAQTKNETYEALADDVQSMTRKAYPESDEKTKNRLAKDAFIGAVADDKVREKLRDRAPTNLEEALKLARQFSASRELEKQRVRMVATEEETETETKAEKDEVRQLREELSKLKTSLKQKPKDRWKKGRDKEKTSKTVICYHCQQPGHIQRWCPQLAAAEPYFHPVTVTPNAGKSAPPVLPVAPTAGSYPAPARGSQPLNSQGQTTVPAP